ncbi:MAG TPA: hypothetical protein VGN42_19045 [Pirellulales bacterium]|jgi:hypothetical protein|nr:hypothetical protein [Pirellulales bacterium]
MIYLDSYGTSLLLDTATPEGLTEWDRLEARLRSSNSLPAATRPLRINAAAPLPPRPGRYRGACRSVTLRGDLRRLVRELEQEISLLGS